MPSYRKYALGLGMTLAAASITLVGTSAGFASPAGTTSAGSSVGAGGVVPDPQAPHVGHVAGAEYGSHISLRNPTTVHAFRVLHRDLIATARGDAQPNGIATIHPSKGTSFDADTVGSQATQSVSTKIKPAQSSTVLYTPTMFPSGGSTPGSCVEVSTAYFHDSQFIGAWDWCSAINFVAQIPIDKSFVKTYTKHHYYSTQIIPTDSSNNTWTAYLYNYKTKKWETFFSQHGTSQLSGIQGWDVYELYSELDGSGQSYACADLDGRRIAAKNIMVGVDGTFVHADASNAGQIYDHPDGDFHCDSFSYEMKKPLYRWKAVG